MYSADGKARICYASRFAHVASRFIIVNLKTIKFKSCSSGVLETENCYICESHISCYYDSIRCFEVKVVEEIEMISQNHSFRPWKQQQLPSPTARGIQSPEG